MFLGEDHGVFRHRRSAGGVVACIRLLILLLGLSLAGWASAQSGNYANCYSTSQTSASCYTRADALQGATLVAQAVKSQGCCGGIQPDRLSVGAPIFNEAQRSVSVPVIWAATGSAAMSAARTWAVVGTPCTGLSNIPGPSQWTGGNGQACKDSCGYEPVQQAGGTKVDGKYVWVTDSAGLKPTGLSCGAEQPDMTNAKTPSECEPIPGQTLCVKPDGSMCATASNGKKLCWRPGETGNKTTGDTVAVKQAGSTHNAPNLQLPSGDTLVQSQPPKTVTNTTIGTGGTSTITSNVATYKTQNGTDAGSSDQADGPEKDDTGGNGASGGGDCKSPPVMSGDAALGMIATQAWATRCAVEAGNATKVTGDIGNCASAFTVEGDNAQAHQLRAMRAEHCGDGPEWAKPKAGEGSNGDPHEGDEGKGGPGTWLLNVGTDLLDTSGFVSGTCPQLGTIDLGQFGELSLDNTTWWCDLIAALRAVMLVMGSFIAIRLLMGD